MQVPGFLSALAALTKLSLHGNHITSSEPAAAACSVADLSLDGGDSLAALPPGVESQARYVGRISL